MQRTTSRKSRRRFVLIDGEELANLMIDHNVAVSPMSVYSVKKLNLDYFDEED